MLKEGLSNKTIYRIQVSSVRYWIWCANETARKLHEHQRHKELANDLACAAIVLGDYLHPTDMGSRPKEKSVAIWSAVSQFMSLLEVSENTLSCEAAVKRIKHGAGSSQ